MRVPYLDFDNSTLRDASDLLSCPFTVDASRLFSFKDTLRSHNKNDKNVLRLERLYSRLLEQARPSFRRPDAAVRKQTDTKRHLAAIREFYDLKVARTPGLLLGSAYDQSLAKGEDTFAFVNSIIDNFGYYADQIAEDLDIANTEEIFGCTDLKLLWSVYFLHEKIIEVYLGLLRVVVERNAIWLEPTSRLAGVQRAAWLATFLEKQSDWSEHGEFIRARKATLDDLTSDELDKLVYRLMDRTLSLNPRYIHKLGDSTFIILLEQVVRFFALLYLYSIERNQLKVRDKRFQTYGISPEIETLALQLRDHSLGRHSGRCALDIPLDILDGAYWFGHTKFSVVLKAALASLIRMHGRAQNPKPDLGDMLGRWFEKTYIRPYLMDIAAENYEVFGEIVPRPDNDAKGYDIDFVLKDIRTKKFYFVQVKYGWSRNEIYLRDKLRALTTRSGIMGGVAQLKRFREVISFPSVRDKLCKIGLSDATENNSHFLLVQNSSAQL